MRNHFYAVFDFHEDVIFGVIFEPCNFGGFTKEIYFQMQLGSYQFKSHSMQTISMTLYTAN